MKKFVNEAVTKLRTLNSYDVSAVQYAKNTEKLYPKEEAHKFMNGLPSGGKIIDIGCGPGRDARMFSDYGFEVVGIDFSPKMIELAKQNAPNCSFHIMDIEALDFPSESFDGVWASSVLLHISKKEISLVLQEIAAILCSKGSFYLSIKQGESETFEADPRYGGLEKHWVFYEKNEIVNLLSSSHFKVKEIKLVDKCSDYDTHPLIKVFAEKA